MTPYAGANRLHVLLVFALLVLVALVVVGCQVLSADERREGGARDRAGEVEQR